MPSPPVAPVVEETTKRLLHRLRAARDKRLAAERKAASKMLGALEELIWRHENAADEATERWFIDSVNKARTTASLARAAGIKSPLPEPQSGEHP